MSTIHTQPATADPRNAEALVRVRDLKKTYRLGRVDVPVLRGMDLDIKRGEWLAVLGASGSGKSTLLHLIGALDRADKAPGAPPITFEGRAIDAMSASDLNHYRRARVGFIFQFYHLLPELTVLENVLLSPMVLHGRLGYLQHRDQAIQSAREILTHVGLGHRLKHRPAELSGGERQRVAIARALVNKPTLLLADEPTGNLDRVTGGSILDLLAGLHKDGQTLVVVTHDPETAARADRVVRLRDGKVVGEA